MRTCEVVGCVRPLKARGMCNTHYNSWWEHHKYEHRISDPLHPWRDVAPDCPHGHSSERVRLWDNDSGARWVCLACKRLFRVALAVIT